MENGDACEAHAAAVVEHCGDLGAGLSFASFRPRGSLARALYQKQRHDEYLSQFDKTEWYNCDLTCLPSDLSAKFVQLGPDQDTINFLEQSERKSDWIFTQIWHSIVKTLLGWFMTQTSING